MIKPESIFSILSDQTRLRTLMLIQSETEVCVCELIHALGESQPKISRHLALMREAGVVSARREGTWMYYRINPDLPLWARSIIQRIFNQLSDQEIYRDDQKQLNKMSNRPEKICT